MSFQEALETHYPGSMQIQAYFSRLQTALFRHGFSRSRALLVVGLCRDELTTGVTQQLISSWGNGFVMNGLAGMLCGGVSSLRAAAAHMPAHDGRERLVLVAQTHIAIDAGGEIGLCSRPGQSEPSHACGALSALAASMAAGDPPTKVDPDDAEYQWLWRRMGARFEAGATPDLLALTAAAHEAIVEDADRLLGRVIDTERADYAVATGIQVHGPGGREYVWPGSQYVLVGGERSELATGG